MNIEKAIQELEEEKNRIEKAILALRHLNGSKPTRSKSTFLPARCQNIKCILPNRTFIPNKKGQQCCSKACATSVRMVETHAKARGVTLLQGDNTKV